jgi:phosphopantetheine adenylyltransferase
MIKIYQQFETDSNESKKIESLCKALQTSVDYYSELTLKKLNKPLLSLETCFSKHKIE